jgi:hypothetical protein
MKKTLMVMSGLLTLVALVVAQEFKSRLPTPPEQVRIAGLQHYPAEDNTAIWTFIPAGGITTNLLPPLYNYIIASNGVAATACILPNPTNSQGAVFNILSPERSSLVISNGSVGSFTINNSTSYFVHATGFLTKTNVLLKVINPYGTNWTAIITSLAIP